MRSESARSESGFRQLLPPWLARYRAESLPHDLVAGFVVALMLVPQSMAYALLAGLPPAYGMYASIVPLVVYAALGTSMTLAVGPVAITSLMTAAALAPLAGIGSAAYIAGAALLALLAGAMLLLAGALRFGFVTKLLSNPVISGFTSGASLLILIGQIPPLLGIDARGDTALAQTAALATALAAVDAPAADWHTAALGGAALALLALQGRFAAVLERIFAGRALLASLLPKLLPIGAVLLAVAFMRAVHWHERFDVAVVGAIPAGLPQWQWPRFDAVPLRPLLVSAAALALINFVSSFSVAQALALKRREKVEADAELRALGAANIASAVAGGLPVGGGFSRSLVSFNAGARTPLAGVVAALCMALVVAQFGALFAALPQAVLAATIIVAVAPAIDVRMLFRAWRYDRADACALGATACGVLAFGVEAGIAIGVGLSLASLVWRSGNPHIAVLGRVPFTEHFRNIDRYHTETLAHVLALRIDENLIFANAQAVGQRVHAELVARPAARHVLLVLSSVSQIDATALDMLRDLNRDLREREIDLNLAEIKGPVLARLQNSSLLNELSGKVFLSTHRAFLAFAGEAEDYAI